MALLKVYNGASWDIAIAKTYNGTAWEDKMKFWNGSIWVELYAGIVVTVSGENIFHVVANGNTARAGVRVNNDGTIDKLILSTYTQIDSSTDWRIPNGSGAGFHVKFTKGFLDPDPDVGTLDTWLALTANREVYYEETANDTADGANITVHISDDGGSTTLDSAVYTLTATVGTPI